MTRRSVTRRVACWAASSLSVVSIGIQTILIAIKSAAITEAGNHSPLPSGDTPPFAAVFNTRCEPISGLQILPGEPDRHKHRQTLPDLRWVE